MSRAAVFLDRDVTINVEKRYLYRYEDCEWIAWAIDAIKTFNTNGFHEHHSRLAIAVVISELLVGLGFWTMYN